MHVGLGDMLTSYMHMDLQRFYGLKPMIYGTLLLNKLRERKHLNQGSVCFENTG